MPDRAVVNAGPLVALALRAAGYFITDSVIAAACQSVGE